MRGKNAERNAFRVSVEQGEAGVAPLPAPPALDDQIVHARLDLTKAKKYLPPSAKLYHYTKTHRIRGFYGDSRLSHGCDLSLGQDVACRVVLTWLWKARKRLHPNETIPFEFSFEVSA